MSRLGSIRRTVPALVAVFGTAALLLVLGTALAAPGDLDPSFGSGGTVETAIGAESVATGIAIQPDGKILVGGWSHPEKGFALARYRTDGSLDAEFGSGGIVTARWATRRPSRCSRTEESCNRPEPSSGS
jgi:uncharacterized delta-60 repeat protein